MHFVSTIFTTIGYGGVTPVTFGANPIFVIKILRVVKSNISTHQSSETKHRLYVFQGGS